MKHIFYLPPRVRLLLAILALAAGLFLSWGLCGTDGLGLLVLLPFAVLFIRMNPELWHGQ
ncbi:hypothetical protein [Oscillibacter sp. GMB15532]|uniref:hypothetical protein n=1 Tax=Oscillibacter sp. GMB15532 TaxID=3230022 RepID=UPI0034DF9C42